MSSPEGVESDGPELRPDMLAGGGRSVPPLTPGERARVARRSLDMVWDGLENQGDTVDPGFTDSADESQPLLSEE